VLKGIFSPTRNSNRRMQESNGQRYVILIECQETRRGREEMRTKFN
jgi:hypothetical protein